MEHPVPAAQDTPAPATVAAPWRNPRLRALAQVIIAGLVLVFLGRAVAREWDTVRSYQWQVQPLWLLAGAALTLARGPVILAGWRAVLARLGYPLRLAPAGGGFFSSGVGQYPPRRPWVARGPGVLGRAGGGAPAPPPGGG